MDIELKNRVYQVQAFRRKKNTVYEYTWDALDNRRKILFTFYFENGKVILIKDSRGFRFIAMILFLMFISFLIIKTWIE